LERAKVGTTPGIDFGESGEGWLRFAYANSEAAIEAALERLAAVLPSLR
jgi:aspartate/methionine/tyrosine aminotransferase